MKRTAFVNFMALHKGRAERRWKRTAFVNFMALHKGRAERRWKRTVFVNFMALHKGRAERRWKRTVMVATFRRYSSIRLQTLRKPTEESINISGLLMQIRNETCRMNAEVGCNPQHQRYHPAAS
jgi:hypothetical protein